MQHMRTIVQHDGPNHRLCSMKGAKVRLTKWPVNDTEYSSLNHALKAIDDGTASSFNESSFSCFSSAFRR